MYPAARSDTLAVLLTALEFSAATIGTMITLVYLAVRGIERVPLRGLERFSHALAGFVILLCGASITFLGL
jgi:hypothetical protein